MLRELHITNLAVLENVQLELRPGLNVFTGQTGAGKSLIIGAFELLLGLRSGGSSGADAAGHMIRSGADEARVQGIFEISDPARLQALSQIFDQTLHGDEAILITRKLFASGRSSVSVNGQPATAAMLRDAGQLLVDIHGQHDHQFLLKPSNQRQILDAFADAQALCDDFARIYHRLRTLSERKRQLQASAALRRQQQDLYAFQLQEIEAVDPQPLEYRELHARFRMLSNLARLSGEAGHVQQALVEADGAVLERLQAMCHVLGELAELDATGLGEIHTMLREATLNLQEVGYGLSRYLSRLELDPAELGEVEDRLNQLNRLIQKYGAGPVRAGRNALAGENTDAAAQEDPVAAVLDFAGTTREALSAIEQAGEDLAQMDQGIADARGELATIATALSAKRQEAANRIKPLIEAQLHELGMPDAALDVAITALQADDPQVGPHGCDQIEILVRTNPGQEARPLRQIASGGELSRVMLAIKSVMACSEEVSVLVFDEIDANIGGRLGRVIGDKLRQLAHGGASAPPATKKRGQSKRAKAPAATPAHQILCITHLPQIAAYADHHLRIEKEVSQAKAGKTTRTTVTAMDDDQRVDELAEMLAGRPISQTSRRQAQELLDQACP